MKPEIYTLLRIALTDGLLMLSAVSFGAFIKNRKVDYFISIILFLGFTVLFIIGMIIVWL